MTEQARRKELAAKYKQTRPEAAVYRIVNTQNKRALLGSSPNLASIRGKLEFAKSITSPSESDERSVQSDHDAQELTSWLRGSHEAKGELRRLSEDIREFGIGAFSLEVLDVLETKPEMTQAQILADLAALEGLWREKADPSLLY